MLKNNPISTRPWNVSLFYELAHAIEANFDGSYDVLRLFSSHSYDVSGGSFEFLRLVVFVDFLLAVISWCSHCCSALLDEYFFANATLRSVDLRVLVDSFVVEVFYDHGRSVRTTLKPLNGGGRNKLAFFNKGNGSTGDDCIFTRVDVWNMQPMGFEAYV
jgi:hypothetical protein